jgi:hypothetical protein
MLSVHRWLSKLSDRAMDKRGLLSITSEIPSRRVTDDIIELVNGWSIDKKSIKWLNDGAFSQLGDVYFRVDIVGAQGGTYIKSDGKVFDASSKMINDEEVEGVYVKNPTVVEARSYRSEVFTVKVSSTYPSTIVTPGFSGPTLTELLGLI